MSINAEKTIVADNDLSLAQRYKLGDPTVRPLGEPSRKFDFLISYQTPHRPNSPIIPTVWDQDEELSPYEEKIHGAKRVRQEKELFIGGRKEEDEVHANRDERDMSSLEVDIDQAGILPLLEQ